MFLLISRLTLIFSMYHITFGIQLPADFEKCHFGDVKCIAASMNDVIRRYAKGMPEIGLQPLNAIELNDVMISDTPHNSPIGMSFKLVNQIIYGFENSSITRVIGFDKDPTKSRLEIYGQVPSLIQKGSFNSHIKFLLFDVNATGQIVSDFQNVRFVLILKVFTQFRNNKRYLKISDLVPVIDLDRWIIKVDNYYNLNTDLNILLNQIFNENWVEFWNELEPRKVASFTKLFQKILDQIFALVSYDDLFLPDFNQEEFKP